MHCTYYTDHVVCMLLNMQEILQRIMMVGSICFKINQCFVDYGLGIYRVLPNDDQVQIS